MRSSTSRSICITHHKALTPPHIGDWALRAVADLSEPRLREGHARKERWLLEPSLTGTVQKTSRRPSAVAVSVAHPFSLQVKSTLSLSSLEPLLPDEGAAAF